METAIVMGFGAAAIWLIVLSVKLERLTVLVNHAIEEAATTVGPTGPPGPRGSPGLQGEPGERGATGAQGAPWKRKEKP